ncbi:MAG: hypothetical protein KR126chlam2_00189 [Chlamydiae bacterium]|nr:hypothetical protein [Chlamydiota bacterium]
MSTPLYTNRLVNEKSPYLLQHAHNPVDWYPWGDEAFKAARDTDKPIFLSIGYATCHWCHVMEQESFESLEVAELMNDTFINVKVDREEQPDIDSLYMEFAQAMMSGGAGWPLNVILTPDLTPFFAATYLPSDATRGFLGMKQLVVRIRQIWNDVEERENVVEQAGKIVDIFASHIQSAGTELPTKQVFEEATELLYKTADPIYGGMRGAPKFPIGFQACFLLRNVKKSGDSRALFYVERTLEMMFRGGIYDHLGGGFSRYTVDERWLVPHFEKMLYDNAILARAYLETWQFTRHNFYREVCEEVLGYILRDLTSEKGGFLSAEDADTEGHEGRFYTWSWEEAHIALGPDASLFCSFYGLTPGGNFEGNNIIHMPYNLNEFAAEHHLDPVILTNKLKELRAQLFELREKRPKPNKDDKIIASWNGLTIYTLAEAGRAFNKEAYLDAAENSARFIRDHLWKDGTLSRRWREGEARFDGCLDDYAFMIHGLISLFEADRGCEWLEFAVQLTRVLESDFKAERGAYYLTNGKDPTLILRRCEFYDGAEPSGNAVHAENLIRLYQITGINEYLQGAEDILRASKEHIDMYPPGACYHLMALQRYLDLDAPTIVVSLNDEEQYRQEIANMLAGHFIPHKAVIWRREMDEELRDLVPFSRDLIPIDGKTTLCVCFRDRCLRPTNDISQMWKFIEKL